MRIFLAVLIVIVLAGAASLLFSRREAAAPPSNKLQVVATIFPLADWLREVGGDDVEVHLLVANGLNPHHFEPKVQDAIEVSRTRVLFAAGLGLDPWAERLAQNTGQGTQLAFFETGRWILPRRLDTAQNVELSGGAQADDDDERAGQTDPHYWLDPARAAIVVEHMAQELARLDPPHAPAYHARAQDYAKRLARLEDEIAIGRKAIPPGQAVVTFHNAYGYLLERLGLKLAAVVQLSPGVEPSARDTVNAVRVMRRIGQVVVFREPLNSVEAAQALAGELNGRVETLDPMDTEASDNGRTYLEREAHNIRALINAFANK